MARRRLTWVRGIRNANTVVGVAPVDTANVLSVRAQSVFTTPFGGGLLTPSVSGAFTLKRLLLWWQFSTIATADATVQPYGAVAARVGGLEEFTEFGTDPAFLATSGPLGDKDADWLLWNPVMSGAITQGGGVGTLDQTMGRGMIDNRSQRRVDEAGEDIFVFSQVQNITAADISTLHISFAALVQTD